MRLKRNELLQQLKTNWPAVIWISGQEPLLNEETALEVIAQLTQQGFSHERFFAGEIEWEKIQTLLHSQGLFSERRLIDIDLRQEKLTTAIQTVLLAAATRTESDVILLVRANERDSAFLKTKWFKNFEMAASVVIHYRANFEETESYCTHLMQKLALSEIVSAQKRDFARLYTGNLLGLKQALVNLSLLDQATLQANDVHEWLSGVVSGSLYDWANFVLVGRLDQALPLFANLKERGTEPSLLLWALVRQLKRIQMVRLKTISMHSPAFYSVSQADKVAVSQGLARFSPNLFPKIWAEALKVDTAIKGAMKGDPYGLLYDLSLMVGGAKTA